MKAATVRPADRQSPASGAGLGSSAASWCVTELGQLGLLRPVHGLISQSLSPPGASAIPAFISAPSSRSRFLFPAQIGTADLRPHRPKRSWFSFSMGCRGRSEPCPFGYRPHQRLPSAGPVSQTHWPGWILASARTMRTVRTVVFPDFLAGEKAASS
jgi:hypothetical protein